MAALGALRPRAALVVLPTGARVGEWVERLRTAGLEQTVTLHEAMGFPGADDPAGTERSTRQLLSRFNALRGRRRGGARDEAPPVLLTTEASCRGIDLPQLDAIVLLYCPLTSDSYVHLAGRAGRGAAEAEAGTVLSVLSEDEARHLGLFSSQLGLPIKPLRLASAGDRPPPPSDS